MTNKVVVTGRSLISPLGSKVKEAYNRLHSYNNCVSYQKELEKYENLNTCLAARIDNFVIPEYFDRKTKRTMGNVAIMAVATAKEALIDANLLENEIISNGQTGVSYGSSSGSMDAILDFYSMCTDNKVKSLNSGSYIKMMPQTTAVNISLFFKTQGRLVTTSTACTSGSMGIGYAYELIKNGVQTVMIAGGAEEFHPVQAGVFDTLYATSIKNDTPNLTPAPFDKDRDGLVIGEGAGTLILEEYNHAIARGAKIYAEIVGFATNTDGTHITNPNSDAMTILMKEALKSANLKPEDISYINAHGTGTKQGDIAESIATYNVFGSKCPISSIKGYTGHTLGACGAIESILTIEMMRNRWFCPTLNLNNPDKECAQLDYIMHTGREIDAKYAMTNNFAFGGINTSIILKLVR
ncbi:MAG: beta-ketoacyl-ACP synthase [Candidatus Gastranaerophilales bacterium]|nr:beta-ketoacyl-ACP synthase [Candidatus Gastranaerophilales bacterium]